MIDYGQIYMETRRADTVAIVAPGWSLTKEDCDKLVSSGATVIAIGDAYKLIPQADILYHADVKWWEYHLRNGLNFRGRKLGMGLDVPRKGRVDFDSPRHLGVDYVIGHARSGFDLIPGHVALGSNSGYQALNVALHFNPRKIIMLGFDLCRDPREGENKGKSHFDGDHPEEIYGYSPYDNFIDWFCSSAELLANLGISVYNCTEHSALECFPKMGLDECLRK